MKHQCSVNIFHSTVFFGVDNIKLWRITTSFNLESSDFCKLRRVSSLMAYQTMYLSAVLEYVLLHLSQIRVEGKEQHLSIQIKIHESIPLKLHILYLEAQEPVLYPDLQPH